MDEDNGKTGEFSEQSREEIFSKAVRAGKRTYFFDVKATRRNDYYLTITESKKRFNRDGKSFYEKHKVFLYKEDFEKFAEGLKEAVDFIVAANPQIIEGPLGDESEAVMAENFTDVQFEDLGETKA
ncbi:MAG: PUR family DNA/RNA-binding protein [Bacteroidales bacterium]|nr:PUR family DNA/RNA-binding protein [Bacteroidales bacterium]MCB9012860.1 PUR family DNA/RNA-binding protein [Bacteroidales bacterium]